VLPVSTFNVQRSTFNVQRSTFPLVLVVADAEVVPRFGELVEFGEELIDRKVGYDEVVILEGGSFGLAADCDHRVHIFGIFGHIADVEIDSLSVEERERFPAPWAAGFHVEDWLIDTTHN